MALVLVIWEKKSDQKIQTPTTSGNATFTKIVLPNQLCVVLLYRLYAAYIPITRWFLRTLQAIKKKQLTITIKQQLSILVQQVIGRHSALL